MQRVYISFLVLAVFFFLSPYLARSPYDGLDKNLRKDFVLQNNH